MAGPETVEAYVSAYECLHNFLKYGGTSGLYCPTSYVDLDDNGEVIEGSWCQETSGLPSVGTIGANLG